MTNSGGSPARVRGSRPMDALDLIRLTSLMERSRGDSRTIVGLIDGPVALDHPGLASSTIREVSGRPGVGCARAESAACGHGTFVAGILVGRRGGDAPAICPGCTLLVRPIFGEVGGGADALPGATPRELAAAIVDCVEAGALVINLSLAMARASAPGDLELDEAIGHALRRGALIVAAAGNQGSVGGSPITRHPWVIPVIGCDAHGRPTPESNLGRSIGARGLSAPGVGITSLGAAGPPVRSGGTSVAAAFVTGAVALLRSEFPGASAATIRLALTRARGSGRATVVPALLDAWGAYRALA